MVATNRTRGAAPALMGMLLLTLMLSYAPAATAQEDGVIDPQERTLRVYSTRFLHPDNAAALAFQVCSGDERCEVEQMGRQGIMLRAVARIHAQYELLLAERDVPPATQEFRVILLRADQSGSMPDVPADARVALEDLRDLLAYTGFEMIDSGLLRTSGSGSTTLGEAGSFRVDLFFVGDPRQDGALLIESFGLAHSQVVWENLDGENGPIPRAHLGGFTSVLSSQFGINVGETVVVGTSRTNGSHEALVVLLTALEH